MQYKKSLFGETKEGNTVYQYSLKNDNGMEVEAISYGATVTSIKFQSKELVLGWNTMEEWEKNNIFAGATVGRFANRISGAKFKIDDKNYELSKNEGKNLLHGGQIGFDKVLWGSRVAGDEDNISVMFFLLSPDGEQGFPGNLDVYVTYTLTNDNELIINYSANTDKPTHVNLSHHSYFNLSEEPTVLNHEIMINADHFTPVNQESIPTGEILPVKDTVMDFRQPVILKQAMEANENNGFDHNFVLNREHEMTLAARVFAPDTKIQMDVLTTLPGVQFYSGNYIQNQKGREGKNYGKHGGLCFEPQYFPDTPNNPDFPSSLLLPEEEYEEMIIYKFNKQ
jgi:aldose 1-epimerase